MRNVTLHGKTSKKVIISTGDREKQSGDSAKSIRDSIFFSGSRLLTCKDYWETQHGNGVQFVITATKIITKQRPRNFKAKNGKHISKRHTVRYKMSLFVFSLNLVK